MIVRGGKIPASHIAPDIFYARGSDCGGNSGSVGRTLSISGVSANEFVYVQGAFLHYPDYSKETVGGVSKFTFIKKIYDPFYIEIYYWM